jgi:integrase
MDHIASAFSEIADQEFHYWKELAYDAPSKRPKPNTITARKQRLNRLKVHFGNQAIDKISTYEVAKYYDTLTSTHEYQKICGILTSIFQFARTRGVFPDHLVNPGQAAQLRRIAKPTSRQTMEPEQYLAIYQEAPEWLQIAMDLILQTALRQQDIWALRWDQIQNDCLFVIPQKSQTQRRSHQQQSHLCFELNKNPSLVKILSRAQSIRQQLIESYKEARDCPYIVMRTDIQRFKSAKTKQSPFQINRTLAAHSLKKARDRAVQNSDAFKELIKEQLPAFHGIRKLSLQLMRKAGANDQYLQAIAAHTDFKLTEESYLTPNATTWQKLGHYEIKLQESPNDV